MAFYGSAKGASFEDQIRMLHTAEVKGSEEYYVLIAQAREHGLNDLADAMQANANEDAAHGGRYASMLGEGVSAEDAIWDRARAFWQLRRAPVPRFSRSRIKSVQPAATISRTPSKTPFLRKKDTRNDSRRSSRLTERR